MEHRSDDTDQLMAALAAMHKQHGVLIEKDKKGHKGTYAGLPQILEQIHEMTKDHGLVLTQGSRVIDGHHAIETILTHYKSKQWISCCSFLTPLETPQSPDQAWGGSNTYHRRYDAMALCGLFADEDPTDHDGNVAFKGDKEYKEPSNKPISTSQVGKIKAMVKFDKEKIDKILSWQKVTDINSLTMSQAKTVIDFLTTKEEGAK